MDHSAATVEELLADYEATSARWKHFFVANPEAALRRRQWQGHGNRVSGRHNSRVRSAADFAHYI